MASGRQERALGLNGDARVDGRGGVGAVEEVWNKEAARGSAWEKRKAAREAQFSLTATSVGLGFRGKRLVVWKRLARLSVHYLSLATPGPPMRGAHQQGVHHHVIRIQQLSARNWPTCQRCQCCHRPLLTGARPISAGGSCQLASSTTSRPDLTVSSQPVHASLARGVAPSPVRRPRPLPLPHRSQVPFADQTIKIGPEGRGRAEFEVVSKLRSTYGVTAFARSASCRKTVRPFLLLWSSGCGRAFWLAVREKSTSRKA